jgi:hypothetical protein
VGIPYKDRVHEFEISPPRCARKTLSGSSIVVAASSADTALTFAMTSESVRLAPPGAVREEDDRETGMMLLTMGMTGGEFGVVMLK